MSDGRGTVEVGRLLGIFHKTRSRYLSCLSILTSEGHGSALTYHYFINVIELMVSVTGYLFEYFLDHFISPIVAKFAS